MKKLTVDATLDNIPVVTDFVNELLEANGCPVKIQMQIDIAIDELFGNIARYGYPSAVGTATVEVELTKTPPAVSVTFIDSGVAYNPLEREDPDVTLSAEERQIGGLGIYMVKKSMDGISYQYQNGCNILKITKNFSFSKE